uniref:C-type lectin domain-containing protein n=1 Tax=Pelodiscus sinensis TaxID=13735 RepID=K7FCS6_PELSI
CLPGWALFQGSCYLFSSTNGTWQVARNNCLAQGADLVVISEQTEQGYLVHRGGSVRYWIGLTDQEREGDWRWVDDTPLTLTFWNRWEPNNLFSPTPEGKGEAENCAQLLETGLWNDEPCGFSYTWICE